MLKKFDSKLEDLRPFLTGMEIYFRYYGIQRNSEKILTIGANFTDGPGRWFQPLADDYIANPNSPREDVRETFSSWTRFKKVVGQIFG